MNSQNRGRHKTYFSIEELVGLMEGPNKSSCLKILSGNKRLFEITPGSRANHQAWPGGYIDHVTECMNYAVHLYEFEKSFGRPMPFLLSDVLLVLFLHDLEKPWREEMNLKSKNGTADKSERQVFREQKLEEYKIILTPEQENGLTYVEGEIIKHSAHERVMNELASFCHMIDNWSARMRHDYPKSNNDE